MDRIDKALVVFESVSQVLLDELRVYLAPYGKVLPHARFAAGLEMLAAGMLAARSPQPAKEPPTHHTGAGVR